MIGYILLTIYTIGVILCFCLVYKINKRENKQHSREEKILDLCLCLFSWLGFLATIMGHVAGYNQLDLDDDEDV